MTSNYIEWNKRMPYFNSPLEEILAMSGSFIWKSINTTRVAEAFGNVFGFDHLYVVSYEGVKNFHKRQEEHFFERFVGVRLNDSMRETLLQGESNVSPKTDIMTAWSFAAHVMKDRQGKQLQFPTIDRPKRYACVRRYLEDYITALGGAWKCIDLSIVVREWERSVFDYLEKQGVKMELFEMAEEDKSKSKVCYVDKKLLVENDRSTYVKDTEDYVKNVTDCWEN